MTQEEIEQSLTVRDLEIEYKDRNRGVTETTQTQGRAAEAGK